MQILQFRADTPGVKFHNHLNNAGAALPPNPVIDAVSKYLEEESLHGGYETAAARNHDIQEFYASCAKLLNTHSRNVVFNSSATEGYNKALTAIPFEKGDVIVTTDDDYSSNQIAFLYLAKRWDIQIIRAAKKAIGGVDVDAVESLIKQHQPKLVAVTHVPTNSGLIQDITAIGALCKKHDIWYLVDACQSAGQMELDVEKIACDFLSATMRKWLRGPRGAGFLYVSDKALNAGMSPMFPDLSGVTWTAANEYQREHSARRFGYWEKNYALMVGSKAAIEYALEIGLSAIQQRITELADYSRQQISTLDGWSILDKGENKCGIVTAHHQDKLPEHFSKVLKTANINAGFAQTGNALIDFKEKGVTWAMRVSPHYYNTKEEIDQLITTLRSNA